MRFSGTKYLVGFAEWGNHYKAGAHPTAHRRKILFDFPPAGFEPPDPHVSYTVTSVGLFSQFSEVFMQ